MKIFGIKARRKFDPTTTGADDEDDDDPDGGDEKDEENCYGGKGGKGDKDDKAGKEDKSAKSKKKYGKHDKADKTDKIPWVKSEATDTISDVKAKFEDKTEITAKHQRLVFDEKPLHDEKKKKKQFSNMIFQMQVV